MSIMGEDRDIMQEGLKIMNIIWRRVWTSGL
jgi:hypothetical protein